MVWKVWSRREFPFFSEDIHKFVIVKPSHRANVATLVDLCRSLVNRCGRFWKIGGDSTHWPFSGLVTSGPRHWRDIQHFKTKIRFPEHLPLGHQKASDLCLDIGHIGTYFALLNESKVYKIFSGHPSTLNIADFTSKAQIQDSYQFMSL